MGVIVMGQMVADGGASAPASERSGSSMPSTPLGRWAVWLAAGAVGLGGVLYGSSIAMMAYAQNNPTAPPFSPVPTLVVLGASIACAIASLGTGIAARTRGDVSRYGMVALIGAGLIVAVFAVFAVGEFAIPH
jgi:hypothetical protein